MKKIFVTVLAALALILPARAQEVVELPVENLNKIIVRLQFKNGSITDPAGKEGLTALTAQLMVEGGTGEWTKTEIDSFIYPMAAGYGASVDKEVSNFVFQFPTAYARDFYPIMIGLITNPSFRQEDFERVKANQLNYVTRSIRNSSDEDYSKMVLEDFLFRGTNYQHMVSGTEAGVNNITLNDVREHYRRYFTDDNVLIGIAGEYSRDFLNQLDEDIDEMPDLETDLPEAPDVEMPDGISVEIVSKPGAFGSAIFMGYPIDIDRSDDDFAALMIANSYLGEHRKSYGRLYEQIREKRSMNYGDYSYIEWYPSGSSNLLPVSGYPRSSNYFSLWIRPVQLGSGLRAQHPELADVELGHAHFAIRMALREVQQMVENGMTEEDFQLTKDFLRSYIKLYVKDPNQRLGYMMDSRFYGRENFIEEMDELLAETTLEDVNEAIREHFQIENMKIAIITTPEEADLLEEALEKNTPSPMSYSNVVKEGLTPEVYETDRQVERFQLNVKDVKIVPTEETLRK